MNRRVGNDTAAARAMIAGYPRVDLKSNGKKRRSKVDAGGKEGVKKGKRRDSSEKEVLDPTVGKIWSVMWPIDGAQLMDRWSCILLEQILILIWGFFSRGFTREGIIHRG